MRGWGRDGKTADEWQFAYVFHGLGVLWLSVSLVHAADPPTPPRRETPVIAVAKKVEDVAGTRFFEQKIRPVLVQHCFECHAGEAKNIKGGLRLDTRAGLRAGGDSGPTFSLDKPEESLLLDALRHDSLEMPPAGKLPDPVIADFAQWIKMGAPDPRGEVPQDAAHAAVQNSGRNSDVEKGRQFWAFQPLRPGLLPQPARFPAGWAISEIDRYIAAGLAEKGIRPVGDADRATLLRRLTIDLTGLPPTPEELDDFQRDAAPLDDALGRAVDRLLASPHFGVRWGRHWLDVVRYADSSGKDQNLTFHAAFRFRDYVVDSFNRDKPIHQLIQEHVAGDLLPAPNRAARDEQLTGVGFLVVGPKVLADRDVVKRKADVVDEQIDTIGRAFLGLTLGCARCHDHKFDPVPTADYYALAGIFQSTRTLDGIKQNNQVVSGWMERPLGPDGEQKLAAINAHQKQLAAIANDIKKVKGALKGQEDRASMRQAGKLIGIVVDDNEAQLVGNWKKSTYTRPYVGEGYIHDEKQDKGKKSARFVPNIRVAGDYEVYISYTAGKGRSTNTPVTVRSAQGEKTITLNQEQPPTVDGLFRLVGKYPFAVGSAGSVTISNQGTEGFVIVDAVRFVPVGALERDVEMAMGVPTEVREKLEKNRQQLKTLEARQKELQKSAPVPPPIVLAVRDEEKTGNVHINPRGNPHVRGAEVPRGFLTVLSASNDARPTIPLGQSGRVELARWLVGPAHPLTARVFVNRVWHHLLGEGLVRTVDDFGWQGERPSHPELLDYLATQFIQEQWSVKKLIRAIVLSRVYRLSSQSEAQAAKVDPENRLCWRARRRRVEAEVLRDSILASAGTLDRSLGGSAVTELGEEALGNYSRAKIEQNRRRSIYLPVIRTELPPIFEVFDFADPDVTTGKRDATTVTTQAFYLLNSTFVMEQAERLARLVVSRQSNDSVRLLDLYRRTLGRQPTADETARALRFLTQARAFVTIPGKPSISQETTIAPKSAKISAKANQKKPAKTKAVVQTSKEAAPSKSDTPEANIPERELAAWTMVCQALYASSEFRFIE